MKKFLSFFWMLVLITFIPFQAWTDDFQLWTELKISHTFPDKKLSLRWYQENRFINDVTQYGLFNTTVGFDYLVFKWLRPGFFFRFEKKMGDFNEYRLIPQIEFLTHLGPIKIEDRNRFEIRTFSDGEVRFRYRNRIKLAHTFKTEPVSFTPFAYEEIFLETERSNPVQNRTAVGNEFGFLHDKIAFGLYYMLKRDKNQDKPGWKNINVLGTSLGFKF